MNEKDNKEASFSLWWVSGVFILLALSFIFDFWGEKREVIKHPSVAEEEFTKDPVREGRFEPTIDHAGFTYRCNECHKSFETTGTKRELTSHEDIVLDHGVVDNCFICHSQNNRQALLDINKNEIPFSRGVENCYQCHGPKVRDWEAGIHGRMNDFWDENKGVTRRLACVECHNPHTPKFKAMKPARAPFQLHYSDSDGESHNHH